MMKALRDPRINPRVTKGSAAGLTTPHDRPNDGGEGEVEGKKGLAGKSMGEREATGEIQSLSLGGEQ